MSKIDEIKSVLGNEEMCAEAMIAAIGEIVAAAEHSRRPLLAFYHANAKGTGCAAKLELRPATACSEGFLSVTMANQRTIGDRAANPPVFPRFEWEGAVEFSLGFTEVAELLCVFRGDCESINDGAGLYHRTARASLSIRFSHVIAPADCYRLEVHRYADGGAETWATISFSHAEAMGLCLALENSFGLLAFGDNCNEEG